MPSRVSPDRWRKADEMIAAGMSTHEINRQTGISRPSIKKRKDRRELNGNDPQRDMQGSDSNGGAAPKEASPSGRRRPDPVPRARRRPATALASDEQLEAMCRKIAKAPAIPAKLVLRCDYCAVHFVTTAPEVARELVEQSQEDPELRAMLDWLYGSWRKYRWAGLLAAWAGVPMIHHLAPGVVYGAVAPLIGMPPRGETSSPSRAHNGHMPPAGGAPPPPATPSEAPPAASPFANLDMDQLLQTARAFGVELPADLDPDQLAGMLAGLDADAMMGGENGDEPEPASEPADSAEPAAAPVEAAAADPDAG